MKAIPKHLVPPATLLRRLAKIFYFCVASMVVLTSSLGSWLDYNPHKTDGTAGRWSIEQFIEKAKADSLTAVSVDAMGPTTTTSKTVYTVMLNATADQFVAGHKYFIYWHMGLASSNATGTVDYQVSYGANVQFTGLVEPSAGTASTPIQVGWMDVYTQPGTAVAVTVGFKNTTGNIYTATALNASLVALDLDDKMISNYDYYYNENTDSYEHTTTATSKASVTLNNADGMKEWMVFAMEDIAIDNAGQEAKADIYDGSTAYMARAQEGEDSDYAEEFTFVLYTAFSNVARGTTYSIRVSDSGVPAEPATNNNHVKSRIFAFALNIFDKQQVYYSGTDVALGASMTEIATQTYAPNAAGNQVIFASYTLAQGAANTQSDDRLTINGTTPLPVGWTWASPGVGRTNYDATDNINENLLTVKNWADTSSYAVDVDGQELSGTSQSSTEAAMILFSTLYAYMPRVNKWRWYGDESGTTPATAYAAENTAPPQEEIGKSIAFKLRINLTEVGNAAENNNRKKLYYSTGTTGTWTIVGATSDTDKAWRYYNGGGADNGTLDGVVLTGSSSGSKGIYNESNSDSPSGSDHPAGTTVEFEYCIENYNATANTTYYFGLFDQTVGLIPPVSGNTANLPTLTTAAAYDLSVSAPPSVGLGDFVIGSSAYHEYRFVGDEKITIRDNRGQTSGNSSGWSCTAAATTELHFCATGTLGNITFTGGGLNDMSHNNTYTGCSAETFTISVSNTLLSPDAVVWSSDLGGSGTFGMSTNWTALANGAQVKWDAVDGHTLFDSWKFTSAPGAQTTITDDNTYWISNSITGLYAAPTTNISTQSGSYMNSAVTAASVAGSGKDGLGGFTQLPILRIYNAIKVGSYTGSITLTLT